MRRACLLALTVSACGSPALHGTAAPTHDLTADGPPVDSQGDVVDQACQIVLRDTSINFSSAGPQTDCSTGTCWVVVTANVDVAVAQDQSQLQPYILYQGASGVWHQWFGLPVFGTSMGFRSYQFVLNVDTFPPGNGANSMQLIPYFITTAGERLWDHNRNTDPSANYQLTPSDNWTIAPDPSVCPAAAPAGTETLTFPTNWQNTAQGNLVPNGKLDLNYDIYRLQQSLGCTTDGVNAFDIQASVQFSPSGNIQSELASGPFDSDAGVYLSLPLEFDVPTGTSSVAIWFSGSNDCGGGTQWDSNYGQNYVYPVAAQ